MTKPQKMDLRANDKSALYKNLSADLKRAQEQLEERIKLGDEKGAKRVQEIVKNLEQTLSRHSK